MPQFMFSPRPITDAQSTDAAAIRDALANITDLDTVLGKFSFDAVGDALYDPGGTDCPKRRIANL